MPADASTSRNAAKWSGSLLASTPSKSKTIARSATRSGCRTHAFAGANRQLQPVLRRRIRTFVAGVVVAVREVRPVEIELVDALRVSLEIQIPAAGVRLGAAGQVGEH